MIDFKNLTLLFITQFQFFRWTISCFCFLQKKNYIYIFNYGAFEALFWNSSEDTLYLQKKSIFIEYYDIRLFVY